MQTFRTTVPPAQAPFGISHSDTVLCIGSCFTEHIGGRLAEGKFPVLLNPFGIVYNPVSMAECLEKLLAEVQFSESELFENQGLWHNWAHHGHFSKPTRPDALAAMNEAAARAADFLKRTNRLLLTLGTATVFALRETGQIVANCHKMPPRIFEKRRLSVPEIADSLAVALQKLRAQNPDLQAVLTVSPVRHLRDGFAENQRSKAACLLACAELCERLPFAHYFPAYELVLDDLRDYRFFEADMVHPNGQAIEYMWQFFSGAFFDAATKTLLARIEKITAAARHRPFNPDTPQHRAFAKAQLEAIAGLAAAFPGLDFSAEAAHFSSF